MDNVLMNGIQRHFVKVKNEIELNCHISSLLNFRHHSYWSAPDLVLWFTKVSMAKSGDEARGSDELQLFLF